MRKTDWKTVFAAEWFLHRKEREAREAEGERKTETPDRRDGLREEIREDFREERREETREELREEIQEEVREEVREELRGEIEAYGNEDDSVVSQKPENAAVPASARLSTRAEEGRLEDFEGTSFSENGEEPTGEPFRETPQTSSDKASESAGEAASSFAPDARVSGVFDRNILSDRPSRASFSGDAGAPMVSDGSLSREGAAGGDSKLSLELLSLSDETETWGAGDRAAETPGVVVELSSEKFGFSPVEGKDAFSGVLRGKSVFGRKTVAADRAHRVRFNAEALALHFGNNDFRAVWRASVDRYGPDRFIAGLFLEGEPVGVQRTRDAEGRTVLTPGILGQDGRIFRDAVGLVALTLTLTVSDPETGRKAKLTLHAEPVVTALPDGPASRRIGAMADAVLSGYGRWLAPKGVTARLRTVGSGAEEEKEGGSGVGSANRAAGVVSEEAAEAVSPLSSDVSDEERGERPETKRLERTEKSSDESLESDVLADDDIPRDRVEALDRILRVYETGLPYFRANPRMKLRREARIDGAEKLRDFSYPAAAYMASHPEHLTPASPGRGIRVGVRHFLPKKVLVESEEKSTDTFENRIVVGFLKTLHAEVEAECARLDAVAAEANASLSNLSDETLEAAGGVSVGSGSSGAPEGYTATDRALAANALDRLRRTLSSLKSRADRIRILHRHYRDAMPVADVLVTGACPPTPVFLSLPAYRMVYEAIRDWERSEWTREEGESGLLTFLRQSRLYECWALTGLLDAFAAEGFRLVRKFRHTYEAPYRDWEQTDFQNTFRFVRREEDRTVEATLFYEPVVRAASGVYDRRGAPLFENGVKFVRTTVFSPEEGTEGAYLKSANFGSPLFYTPDFLLRIRVREERDDAEGSVQTFWAVADAKYSTVERVARERAMPAAFKYLFGMRPIDAKDRVLGLWLFCGKPAERSGGVAPQSFNAMGAGAGFEAGPDVHVVEMVPEERSEAKAAGFGETPWAKWIRSVLKEV